MTVKICNTKEELGIAAAASGADIIRQTIQKRGKVNIILATGASQFEMLEHLKKVEDIDLCYDKVVIVAVHSHANMKAVLDHIKGKVRSMIAIECCVPYNYGIKPNRQYFDAGIWSPRNKVKIWRSI